MARATAGKARLKGRHPRHGAKARGRTGTRIGLRHHKRRLRTVHYVRHRPRTGRVRRSHVHHPRARWNPGRREGRRRR
ncbi:hypothetical protein GCM10010341_73270 [Streptomyces noursei]|nr:hypothetical protein GCM10010341_73270 [Streptomyces noursei]